MGLMDELKKLARPYAEDEDDFEDEYDEEEELEEEEQEAPVADEKPTRVARPERSERNERGSRSGRGANNVVNLHTNTNLQVMLVKPERYENVSEIADYLRSKCAVVLNLESTNKDTARRIVDFLSGCGYALDGNIKKVAMSTYILTPYNVDIVGDLMEEMENSGVYF